MEKIDVIKKRAYRILRKTLKDDENFVRSPTIEQDLAMLANDVLFLCDYIEKVCEGES